ncbi:histidine kinase N-terminal 7TM domain-containing protein [Rubrivirga sp. IMCC43871]|uniref:sensor histidine kinase n=1 Tax=Rubrivirga sp. IMCC43871 TaxID=3391575 RepID=UPI00398FCC03
MSYLVFAVLTPFAVAAMAWAVWIARRRGGAPGARPLAYTSAASAVTLLAEFGEMVAPTARLSLASEQLVYVALPWLCVGWLVFALEFTGRRAWGRSWAVRTSGAVAAATTVVALTAAHHGWLWASIEPVQAGPFRDHVVAFGPWFWVHAVASWATVVGGSTVLLREYGGGLATLRRLSVWLAVASFAPLVVNLAYLSGLTPLDKSMTTIAFAFSSVVFAASTLRFRFLDLQPTARSVLMESLDQGFVSIGPAGRITDFNGAFRALAGERAALGEPIGAVAPALAATLEDEVGEVALDGPRHYAWRAVALPGARGRSRGRIVLLHDVTERRAAEAAVRAALAEVQARNADLDAFAHTVAHDLKNPIHAIRGYADLLRVEGETLDRALVDESADVVVRMADKMNSIIDELLLLAGVRDQTVTPGPVEMGAAVAGALERLRPFLDRHRATVDVPGAWPGAVGYGPWVEEVWANYLSNAAKYGGHRPRIALGAARVGDAVRFWVDDDGPGLSADERAAVFAPFARAHGERADSHGLGLSIVARVLDKLDGAYGAERSPSGGSRFYFELPAAEPAAVAPHAWEVLA